MPPTADNVSPKDPLLLPENNCFVNVAIVRSKRRRSFFFFSFDVLETRAGRERRSLEWMDRGKIFHQTGNFLTGKVFNDKL